jgi:hypothetical protein
MTAGIVWTKALKVILMFSIVKSPKNAKNASNGNIRAK